MTLVEVLRGVAEDNMDIDDCGRPALPYALMAEAAREHVVAECVAVIEAANKGNLSDWLSDLACDVRAVADREN